MGFQAKLHPIRRRVPAVTPLLLGAAALLSACETNRPLPGPLGDLMKQPAPGGQAGTGQAATAATRNGKPGAAEQLGAPLATRQPQGLQSLFAKGTVNGRDLMTELTAIKSAGTRRGGHALSQLLGQVPDNGDAAHNLMQTLSQSGSVRDAGVKVALGVLERELKGAVRRYAFQQLTDHFATMTGDPKALEAETVQLPPVQALTPQQAQRVVTMAAMLVATRMTGKMLKQAQQDAKSLDQEYAHLISRREQAAKLLQDALAGGLSGPSGSALTGQDLSYLRTLSVGDFVKDMGAQNLALRYLRVADPAAYKSYQVESEGLSKRAQAVARTLSGTAAFGAMVALFSTEMSKVGRNNLPELLISGPILLSFLTEVPAVLSHGVGAWTDTLGSVWSDTKTYRVSFDGKTEDVGSASAVFKRLRERGVLPELQQAMFRDASRGLLHSVYQCDRTEAGRMLDTAVDGSSRAQFAKAINLPDPDEFSFTAAFDGGDRALEGRLAGTLLARDHRLQTAEGTLAYATLQKAVADGEAPGFQRWNDDQLLRLIFANREDEGARYAALDIKGVMVRPVPSMRSLAAYEQLTDACRREVVGLPPQATTNRPGVTRPGTGNRTTKPAATSTTPAKKGN